MKSVIYETKGRAREFNELAINLYTGCGHRCIYCYGPAVTHKEKSIFYQEPQPRVTPGEIQRSAAEWQAKGETRRVLLCFVTDPYQPIEQETRLTRSTIEILHEYGMGVTILTKGGERSMRDFDLLKPGLDAYATTLTLTDPKESVAWEPRAGLPHERIAALTKAHELGIETWVSFEPVIRPADTFRLLYNTLNLVDHYKVGTMNYHPAAQLVDWAKFGRQMKATMDGLGVKYYFKHDLLKKMGIDPADFQQTWVCR